MFLFAQDVCGKPIRCSRKDWPFSRQRKIIFIIKTRQAIGCAVNFYNAGAVTQGRRMSSKTLGYFFAENVVLKLTKWTSWTTFWVIFEDIGPFFTIMSGHLEDEKDFTRQMFEQRFNGTSQRNFVFYKSKLLR
jgi:hypothetical protein